MKRIISIFIIVMILGVMFAGCDKKEVAVESNGFDTGGTIYETVIPEKIIYEDVITENIIYWDDVVG